MFLCNPPLHANSCKVQCSGMNLSYRLKFIDCYSMEYLCLKVLREKNFDLFSTKNMNVSSFPVFKIFYMKTDVVSNLLSKLSLNLRSRNKF